MIKKVEVHQFDLEVLKVGLPIAITLPNSSDEKVTYGLIHRAFEDSVDVTIINYENDVEEITFYPADLLNSKSNTYVVIKMLA